MVVGVIGRAGVSKSIVVSRMNSKLKLCLERVSTFLHSEFESCLRCIRFMPSDSDVHFLCSLKFVNHIPRGRLSFCCEFTYDFRNLVHTLQALAGGRGCAGHFSSDCNTACNLGVTWLDISLEKSFVISANVVTGRNILQALIDSN
jgi:hypothetical protein